MCLYDFDGTLDREPHQVDLHSPFCYGSGEIDELALSTFCTTKSTMDY
jgi:hypothetical protein